MSLSSPPLGTLSREDAYGTSGPGERRMHDAIRMELNMGDGRPYPSCIGLVDSNSRHQVGFANVVETIDLSLALVRCPSTTGCSILRSPLVYCPSSCGAHQFSNMLVVLLRRNSLVGHR